MPGVAVYATLSEALLSRAQSDERVGGAVQWFHDRWTDLVGLGSATWLTIAAWAGLLLAVLALIFVARVITRNRQLRSAELRPHVVMYMEPNATDWHVIELVVRNFGKTAAHEVQFEFPHRAHRGPLRGSLCRRATRDRRTHSSQRTHSTRTRQEWRTIWDSAINREELGGGEIQSRFEGALTYRDRTKNEKGRRQEFHTEVVLDWATLPPVQRLD